MHIIYCDLKHDNILLNIIEEKVIIEIRKYAIV